jgi:hypothetical protein
MQFRPVLTISFLLIRFCVAGQDDHVLATELQKQYKDNPAAILWEEQHFEFQKDVSVNLVKVIQKTNKKILSLRYNSDIFEFVHYDSNSSVDKLSGESSLKQSAPDAVKFCGNYTSEGLFYDDSKFCSQKLKLKEVGEVWTVTSGKRINDSKYLTCVYFQDVFPVVEKSISFTIPADIDIELKEYNFKDYTITKAESPYVGKKVIKYTIKNAAGTDNANYKQGAQFSSPHILVLVKSATFAGKKVNQLSSADDLYAWYRNLILALKPKPELLKPMVDQLIAGKTSDEEKVKAIYYWVQENIRYIAYEDGIAGFKPDEAQNVFEKKFGDCKGMANLTKEMLKLAGYDARLTWIGTKRIAYDYSVPSLAVDNHMICALLLNGKKYYLDATEKYCGFGDYAERIQGRPVMIEDGEKYILDKVPEFSKDRDMETNHYNIKLNGEIMEGSFNAKLNGEPKKSLMYRYHNTESHKKEDCLMNFINDNNSNIKVTNIKKSDLNDRSAPLSISSDLSLLNAVSSFNNEYYVDMDPSKLFKNWEIRDERQSNIDFGEKIYKKINVELEVPQGFTVGSLPESLEIRNPEFSFVIDYKVKDNKVCLNKEIIIEKGIIKKENFSIWNEAIKKLTKAYENQVTLKK